MNASTAQHADVTRDVRQMHALLHSLAEPETRTDPNALLRLDAVLIELRGPRYPGNIRVKAERLMRTFSQWLGTQDPDADLLTSRLGRQLHIRLFQLCGALAVLSRHPPASMASSRDHQGAASL